MDRLIHTALSGMRASMDSQRVIASNMANANTLGFRAELLDQRAVTIEGQPLEARAMQVARVRGADMVAGEIIETGRDLDIAMATDALMAVQAEDGTEPTPAAVTCRFRPPAYWSMAKAVRCLAITGRSPFRRSEFRALRRMER